MEVIFSGPCCIVQQESLETQDFACLLRAMGFVYVYDCHRNTV